MKTLLSTIVIIFSFSSLIAQPAPDFSVTDVSGNTHQLYNDYLNNGKTVLIKLYFTTCPPCRSIAPSVQALYEDWGSGQHDVQFFDITVRDFETDSMHLQYKTDFGITFPTIGGPGGALAARTPYIDGTYGQYTGTPGFIVIGPDGTVNYNIRGGNASQTISLLDDAIAATGAVKPGSGQDQAPISRNATKTTPFNTPAIVQLEFFGQDSPVDSSNIHFIPNSGIGTNGGTFSPAQCPA
ncbi:MAG: redoxin domain-containing protein, partial [Bacteroidota bacterium]